jgi:hypothetical protein
MQELLDQVGRHLDIARPESLLPAGTQWSREEGADGRTIVRLEIEPDVLCGDIQDDGASSPTRALCLAAWLEELGTPARAEVVIRGTRSGAVEHYRRSLFLLEEYARLAPDLFSCRGALRWAWPRDPVFNVEGKRDLRKAPRGAEAKLAAALRADPAVRDQLEKVVGAPVEPLRDQLPVGLFEGEVDRKTHWTPGGSSAVDLWTRTMDKRELHLFELKAGKSRPFGILPEAFYYARMLSYVRDRPEIDFDPSGDGMTAARRCSQLVMWLSAPGLHPLVYHPTRGSAPLQRLCAGLALSRVRLGVLPVEDGATPAFSIARVWTAPT